MSSETKCFLYAPNFFLAVETKGIVLNQQWYLMVTGWYRQSFPALSEDVENSKQVECSHYSLQISSFFIK